MKYIIFRPLKQIANTFRIRFPSNIGRTESLDNKLCYAQASDSVSVPTEFQPLELSETEFKAFMSSRNSKKKQEIQEKLDQMDINFTRQQHITLLNEEISNARQRYVPNIYDQDDIYAEKVAQATDFLTDDEADGHTYPFIALEAELKQTSLEEAANNILNKRKEQLTFNLRTERIRMQFSIETESATFDEIIEIYKRTVKELHKL